MEKTLSMGAFTELDEQETIETDGGWVGILIGAGLCVAGLIGTAAIVASAVNQCNESGADQVRNSENPSAYYNYDSSGNGTNDCYRYTTYSWSGPQTHYVY